MLEVFAVLRLALVGLFGYSWYKTRKARHDSQRINYLEDQVFYLCLIIIIDMVVKFIQML